MKNNRLSEQEQQELLDSEPPVEYMGRDGALYTVSNEGSPIISSWFKRQEQIINDPEPLPF